MDGPNEKAPMQGLCRDLPALALPSREGCGPEFAPPQKRRRCNMAQQKTRPTDADQIPLDVPPQEEPVLAADDPGGAHAKGYSADPRPEQEVPADGPIPLASLPDDSSH